MLMREINKKNNRKGFTLVELLGVVLIIAVVAAICVPVYGTYQKSLKMKTLNDTARQLFLVAENELAVAKESGTLNKLYAVTKSDGEKVNSTAVANDELYFANSDNSTIIARLGGEKLSVVAGGGSFTVEFNPISGSVYSVFYADEAFDYDEVKNARGESERSAHEPMIGYYSGSDTANTILYNTSKLKFEDGDVSFINNGELYLKIHGSIKDCEASPSFANAKLKIVFTDQSGNKETVTFSGLANQNKNGQYISIDKTNKTFDVCLLLDSIISDNYSIKKLYKDLTPGEDITAAVTLTYGNLKDKAEKSVITNSLFAYRSDKTDKKTAGVGNVRQLYNIGVLPAAAASLTFYQLCDIDFTDDCYVWYADGTNGAVYDVNDSNSPAPTAFGGVTEKVTKSFIYNGNKNKLLNFNIVTAAANAGIFCSAENVTFKNIIIVNPVVKTTKENACAGALAGSITGCTVTNCGAYATEAKASSVSVTGNVAAGGLLGKVNQNSQIENSFAAIPTVSADAADGDAGGFIGVADGSAGKITITGCYGNVTTVKTGVHAGSLTVGRAGGFAGSLQGVEQSYSYGVTEKFENAAYQGGFTAKSSGNKFEHCYALIGSVATGSDHWGFCRESASDTLTDCAFYASELAADSNLLGATRAATVEDLVKKYKADTTHWQYDYNSSGTAISKGYSHPYNTTGSYSYMSDKTFVGLRIKGLHHYGNWPEQSRKYTVSFDTNGGTPQIAARTVNANDTVGAIDTVTKEGCTFGGWYTAGGELVTASTVVTGDITCYARWNCTVTFDTDGGTPQIASRTVKENDTVGTIDTVTKNGYEFIKWVDKDNTSVEVTASTTVTKNMTVVAQWKKKSYNITYDLNSDKAKFKNNYTPPTTYDTETGATLPTKNNLTANGQFLGWFLDDAGEAVTAISPGETGDKHFVAHWKYKLTYDANDGTGATKSFDDKKFTVKNIGASDLFPGKTRAGYRFIGWCTSASYGSASYYAIGDQLTLTEDTTLYAVWLKGVVGVARNGGLGVSNMRYDLATGTISSLQTGSYYFVEFTGIYKILEAIFGNGYYVFFEQSRGSTQSAVPDWTAGWLQNLNESVTSGSGLYRYQNVSSSSQNLSGQVFTFKFGQCAQNSSEYLYTLSITYSGYTASSWIGRVKIDSVSETCKAFQ